MAHGKILLGLLVRAVNVSDGHFVPHKLPLFHQMDYLLMLLL
jgi:hypothetical protein